MKLANNLMKNLDLLGTDKEISVRVRSDLHNIIKNAQSIIQDYKDFEDIEDINIDMEGAEKNGEI